MNADQQLFFHMLSPEIANSPYNFVMFNYPWGKEHSPLQEHKGPRSWQRGVLQEMEQHIKDNHTRDSMGLALEVFREAVSSGRGIGKSALVAWLADWFRSTRIGSTTIIAANSEAQLKGVTWGEIGKWHALSMNQHWFDLAATAVKPQDWFSKLVKQQLQRSVEYYYVQAKLWSEENPDAFAGIHNPMGVLLLFDEASGIPPAIWKVSEGFFTEPVHDRYWFAFSNPRRNTGAFFECFHKDRDFWKTRHIDSRSVEGTDRKVFDKIIQQYGDDSDVARVEVKGEFPRQGDMQFISREVIQNAVERPTEMDRGAALIMGVDVARFGDDSSVIRFRRGRDGRSIPPITFKNIDNMQLAYRCAEAIAKYAPDAIAIDAGNGTGVIDRLKEMGFKVSEIWFGSRSNEPEYANKRTEMWGRMREWLNGGFIDAHQELIDDLSGPEYKFAKNGDSIQLESKEQMKARGLHSPDHGDALALTFAVVAARKDIPVSRHNARNAVARNVDYDIFRA
jgi:hypothetical protein